MATATGSRDDSLSGVPLREFPPGLWAGDLFASLSVAAAGSDFDAAAEDLPDLGVAAQGRDCADSLLLRPDCGLAAFLEPAVGDRDCWPLPGCCGEAATEDLSRALESGALELVILLVCSCLLVTQCLLVSVLLPAFDSLLEEAASCDIDRRSTEWTYCFYFAD